MMSLRLYLPQIQETSNLSPALRSRLQRVAERAVIRAAAKFNRPSLEVLVQPAPQPPQISAQRPRDRRPSAALYDVPSYQDAGRPVGVPVLADQTGFAGMLITEAGDQIVAEEFSTVTVLQSSGNHYVKAGGRPYVIATNLARAVVWGRNLFGGQGFAVLCSRNGSRNGPFYTVRLEDPLRRADLGRVTGKFASEAGETVDVVAYGRIVSPANYETVAVYAAEGWPLVSLLDADSWNVNTFQRALAGVPGGQRGVAPDDLRSAANALIRGARSAGGEKSEVDLILQMDHTLFAAMPWQERARYLELLIDAGTGEREEIAILEIFRATRNIAELEAIAAELRAHGKYEQLFDDLDGNVYALLKVFGEYRPSPGLDWRYLVSLTVDLNLLTWDSPPPDPLRELRRVVAGALDWLSGMVQGIIFLITEPGKVIEGLSHLIEFLWTIEKARWGDADAQAFLSRLVGQAGASLHQAIRGLEYAEELGSSYGRRARSSGIGEDILGRLKAALLLEVLSWFIGIGEIRVAITGAEMSERLAALARVLSTIRFFGRASRATRGTAQMERVLAALARAAHIVDDAAVVRAVEWLPESDLTALERIATAVDLPEGATLKALRNALRAHPALAETLTGLGDTLAVASRLEAKAAEVGGVTTRMTSGFHTLLSHAPSNPAQMVELVEHVPAVRLEEFLHTMTFVRPEHFSQFGLRAFKDLAEHPRALALVREGGSDLLNVAFGRTGRSWESLELFMDGLAARRGQIGDPAQYQQLLERLARGEAAAFEEVADVRHAQRLAEAAHSGQTAQYGLSRLDRHRHRSLLETLDDMGVDGSLGSVADRDRYASQLARMTDHELDGMEFVARWEHPNRPHAWTDVLDELQTWTGLDRSEFLRLMGDVGPHVADGLDDVIAGIFSRSASQSNAMITGVQGSFGQLYAARTLIRRYGATGLRFEVTEISGGLRREVDILFGNRRVEVKTNLGGVASFNEWQITKDLSSHAGSRYDNLLYLYHPSVGQQEIQRIGSQMLDLFNGTELQNLLRARGIDPARARVDFQQWLARGGVSVYDL